MANRAYLYSRDLNNPNANDLGPQADLDRNDGTPYYDSRHGIPWAWLFLFAPSAPKLVEVRSYDGQHSYPVLWLVALKEAALSRFARHRSRICEIAGTQYDTNSMLDVFVKNLKERAGDTLIADFGEVLDDAEYKDAAYFRTILNLIDAGASIEAIRKAIEPYSQFEYKDEDEFELWVTGYTYW